MPDISIVVNAHREGELLVTAVESANAARRTAAGQGLSAELLLVLDRPDAETRGLVEARSAAWQATPAVVDHGDLALSRNHGVALAGGRYVAFLDGDDLWGDRWLADACDAARRQAREVIWHPEVNVVFGHAEPYIFLHRDMEDPGFDADWLRIENYWTALSFGERSVFARHPYAPNRFDLGHGYEDWSWNMATIAAGVVHKVVAGTLHCIRRKPEGSLLSATAVSRALPDWQPLFGPAYSAK